MKQGETDLWQRLGVVEGREGGERGDSLRIGTKRSIILRSPIRQYNEFIASVSLSCLSQFKLCNLSCALHGGGGGGSALIRGICLYCVNILDIVTDYCK